MESVTSAMTSVLSSMSLGGSKDKSQQGEQPKAPTEEQLKELREKYEEAEQDHVFKFYDELDGPERATLYHQLANLPPPSRINELAKKVLGDSIFDTKMQKQEKKKADEEQKKKEEEESKESGESDKDKKDDQKPSIEPLPESATTSTLDSTPEFLEKLYEDGLDLVAGNKVAVVLMAGGQGTRLGSSAPKGCYNIGLPSEKSLFQLQAERILKVQRLAAKKWGGRKDVITVPWYVMTSGPTRGPTEAFFKEHNYFGLKEEDVFIFEQGVLPCISNEGKILLETKSKVAVAPDGNGGIYAALITSGAVQDMSKRGIQHIHAYCVDNCLVRVADPTFLGFAAMKKVDIATKVVRKRSAKEPVGLIIQKNGKPDVVEYSEIDSQTAEATDGKNKELLKFRAANIVNHYYSFSFLESIPEWMHDLPHHVAKKKIPCVDIETGDSVKPEKPNGIKLEQFVFDCFPFLDMDKFACMEVKREEEFSPLKNGKGTGEDDPDTSKKDIMMQGRRWIEAAGGVVEDEGDGAGVEVSPLVSYGGEGLGFTKGKPIKAPAVIDK